MSLLRRDYIVRMLEQLSGALANIAGLREAGHIDEADRLWRETADAIFGPMLTMLERVDSESAARLLDNNDKILAHAMLSEERSAIRASRADGAGARADARRALELYLERSIRSPEIAERERTAIAALAQRVDTDRLAARYEAALQRMGHR
jgi:hypothetical protein